MSKPVNENSRYMAGLDGLRAFAILAVLAYHFNLGWAPGGLLGVGIFFTLSGYLITDLLLQQWIRHGYLDIKEFLFRRARRLLPAQLVVLASVATWLALFDPGRLPTVRDDILATALYVGNWWFIFHKVPYFSSFGPQSPLGHLWSLAVEEQFYLVWPFLLWLGLRYVARWKFLSGLSLTLAATSAVAMALLYHPGADPTRVYEGTDTRAFGLMIGAALAFIWPSLSLPKLPPRSQMVMDLVGVGCILALVLAIYKSNEYQEFYYRGGLALLAVVSAFLVAVLAHPDSRLGRAFAWKPLIWLGVRSYGIYLWHYPIIVLTSPSINTEGVRITQTTLQFIAVLVLAELSWRFVESPIRHGVLGQMCFLICEPPRQWRGRNALRAWSYAVGILLVAGVLCTTVIACDGGSAASVNAPDSVTLAGPDHPQEAGSAPTGDSRDHQTVTQQAYPTILNKTDISATGQTSRSGHGVTAIGDSMLIGVAPYLEDLLPGIVIDGQVGRQLTEGQAVVAQLKEQGRLGSRVIIQLGSNGPFSQDQLRSLLNSLGQTQQVVMVNTRVPRPWQDSVNQTIEQIAADDPRVTLVNWFLASEGKGYLFYSDGVHLQPDGYQYYANLLANAVQQVAPPDGSGTTSSQ